MCMKHSKYRVVSLTNRLTLFGSYFDNTQYYFIPDQSANYQQSNLNKFTLFQTNSMRLNGKRENNSTAAQAGLIEWKI